MLGIRIAPTDRRLSERLDQLRRDLRGLADGWRGRRPPPVQPRQPRGSVQPRAEETAATTETVTVTETETASAAAGLPRPGLGAREVVIAARIEETAEAVTLLLEDPSGAAFSFTPGAFFTVVVDLDGDEVRRAYSASSSILEPQRLALTCKRVPGGRVSTYLHREVAVGDRLRLLGPSGEFTITPDPAARRRLVLIGGGSGITPLMAMIRALLAIEGESEICLIYGNREPAAIIFNDALAELAAAHPGRLHVHHVVEAAPAAWEGAIGRLDRAGLGAALAAVPWPKEQVDGWYVCGPEPVLAATEVLFDDLAIPEELRHYERFTAPQRRQAAPTRAAFATPVTIRRGASESTVIIPPGMTLLEGAQAAGYPLPFSCAVGGCGACRVRVLGGEVVMDEPNCLSPAERAAGYALACCGAPVGPCEIEVGR